ncbi:MAG: putative DNA-binding domain-containing protein [Pseudomonadota bacterium]
MPTPPERLAALQKQFADHIRDPDNHPAPDHIEDRRMAIYRRLFFNNLSNLFGKNFPRVKTIVMAAEPLPDSDYSNRWQDMIRAFMDLHRSTTPLFPELGREFVRFLIEHPDQHAEWPWLAELADWEFTTTSVRNDEHELGDSSVDRNGDLLSGSIVVNPTLRLASYQWPVHQIRPNAFPEAPAPILFAVFRKPDDKIGKIKINPVTARLLVLLQENPTRTGQSILHTLAGEMNHPNPAALIEHGRAMLASLTEQQLLLGRAV